MKKNDACHPTRLRRAPASFPLPLLRACLQEDQTGTKYSNVFDSKSGDIFLFPSPGRDDDVKFNLAVELEKGGHYYDIPKIRQQLAQAPMSLLNNMKRFFEVA